MIENLTSKIKKETGEGKTEATDIGDEFEVVFKESNRYYTVDKDGNVGEVQKIIEDKIIWIYRRSYHTRFINTRRYSIS